MSGLRLTLKAKPSARLDLSGLTPDALIGLSADEIARLPLGETTVGDVFEISGDMLSSNQQTLVFAATNAACDGIASGQRSGTTIVEGDAGAYAARGLRGGRLDIHGNAGAWLAAGMAGGLVTVKGSAGDYVGAMTAGHKFGMSGGTVHVSGDIGERAGDRMRRGTIIVKGKVGPAAGSRMAGGTIWTETGFGTGPGPLLRRGTLIGPKVERMLSTFSDCGGHDLTILRLLNRHMAEMLGPLAPPPLPAMVRRYAGDMATIGKGEILLTA